MTGRTATLEDVIGRSPVRILGDGWSVLRASGAVPPGEHLLTMRADGETTVVTRASIADWPAGTPAECGYALLALDVAAPFAAPGFLAAACGALGAAGINVLAYSAFSRDYLLVRDADVDGALAALVRRGFPIADGGEHG